MDLQIIQSKIYEIRGCRVMLDSDLAALYQVETKALKQAVKRNADRFPDDFITNSDLRKRYRGRSKLEVTNCDLKLGWLPLSEFRVYRTGRGDDFVRAKKRYSRKGEYLHHAGFRPYAPNVIRLRRASKTHRRTGTEYRRTIQRSVPSTYPVTKQART